MSGGVDSTSPLVAALRCSCPRCGRGKLFQGLLSVTPRCAQCGLDFGAVDAGDGPAVFVMLVLGALVVLSAFLVERIFSPPLWVHPLLWIPVTLGGAALLLRHFKGWLIAMQYRHHRLSQSPR